MTFTLRSVLLGFGCVFMLFGGVAQARSANQAEAHRLETELRKLAQRNAWSGVERTYKKLIKLKKVTIKADSHLLGAQAARNNADVKNWTKRLEVAGSAGAAELRSVKATFGKVKLKAKKGAVLKPKAGMPFDPVHRKLVQKGIDAIKKKGKYKGWLPKGEFIIADTPFVVAPNKTTKVRGR